MPRSEEYAAARAKLEEAIKECDRLAIESHGDEPRDPNEVLTHWVVVFSHTKLEDDQTRDSTQVSSLRSDGMSYWQAVGLMAVEQHGALREPFDEEDE